MAKHAKDQLTDSTVRSAKAKDSACMFRDGGGLYLVVDPSGRKWWKLRLTFGKKENSFSLGEYPTISLKAARIERDKKYKEAAAGIDPGAARKAEKARQAGEGTYESIAREWHAKREKDWSERHKTRTLRDFERDVFPYIGSRLIDTVTSQEMLSVLRRVETRSLETAHKIKTTCGQVFRYAIVTGRATNDPTLALQGALATVHNKRMAAPTSPVDIGPLLLAIDGYKGTFVVQCALKLSPLLFVRPGELRKAEWKEIDLEKREWRIPIERMKRRQTEKNTRRGEIAHIVPFSRQAVAILEDLYQLTGNGIFVFPGARGNDRPLCDNALNAAFRRMGFTKDEIVVHGFRHMASTLLHEKGYPSHLIEKQLSHADRNNIRATYNYAEYMAERIEMMQAWADYLDELKTT
jgi:integrase